MAKRVRVPPGLYDHYKVDPNPNKECVLELARVYKLSKKRVLRFFQNKRAREFPKKPSKSEVSAPPPSEANGGDAGKDELEEFWKRMAIELQ